jgi:hypothetical protein
VLGLASQCKNLATHMEMKPKLMLDFCGGKTLLRLFPSPDPTRVGASGTGSALFTRSSKNY